MTPSVFTEVQERDQLIADAAAVQKRREEVVKKRIAENKALRRIGDQYIADEIQSKDIN